MPEFVKSFVGHSRKITGLSQLVSDGKFFVSSSTDKTLLLWNITNEENKTIYTSKVEIKSIITFQDEIYLIEDRNIKVVNPFTKKNKTAFKTSSTITCLDSFYDKANDNLFFAVGTSEGEIIILSGKNHKKIRSFVLDGSPITSLKFFQDENYPKLATGTIMGNVGIYEGSEFYFLIKMINTRMGEITAIEWDSRNECKLFVGNNRGIVQIWDLSKQVENKRIENLELEVQIHNKSITQLTFDHFNNNPTLWTCSVDTTLKAWYVTSGLEDIFELRPTNYPIICLKIIKQQNTDSNTSKTMFSRKLLIGSNDHTIKLYEVAILNYFSLVWGLRNAIIEKWIEWKKKIQDFEFPNSFNGFLDQFENHLTLMIKENKKIIYSYIKQLFDHQWTNTIKKFDEILKSHQLKATNEEDIINDLLESFEKQILSMDTNFSNFLAEKLISDYNKHLNKISSTFLIDFLSSFENSLNKIIKSVTESPKIQESLNLPSFPDWFFFEISFLLKKKKELWIDDLKKFLEPNMKKLSNSWFQRRRDALNDFINLNEPQLRKDISMELKEELLNILRSKLENQKNSQMNKVNNVETVFKDLIRNKSKFIYLYDLSSQINLLPSVILNEINNLINRRVIDGILEKDNNGYFFVNIKNNDFISRKEKIESKYEKLMQKKKKKEKDLEKTLEEINTFLEFCHSYNIYHFDNEYIHKREEIRKEIKERIK
ncbi:MAG: hypothetical protein ACW981_15275 [Candidatus Hodarchaeales archaeon]